jgi:hypothetical protein
VRARPSIEFAEPTLVAARAELEDAEATLNPKVSDNAAATAPSERTKPFISCSFRMRFAIAVGWLLSIRKDSCGPPLFPHLA